MDREYSFKLETEDFELLKEFNEKVFQLLDLGRTPRNHHSDASGLTPNARDIVNIEIKKRNQNLLRILQNQLFL